MSQTLVMGIVNVTPDSFSDGGDWFDPDRAIAHGRQLLSDGADIIDIGGESTRPGATRLDSTAEIERIERVARTLIDEGASVSIDTVHSATAAAAIKWGADYVNDVSGGLADTSMYRTVAEGIGSGAKVRYICQHMRGIPETMNEMRDYPDGIVVTVIAELSDRVWAAERAGIPRERIIWDPGLGFAKTGMQDWEVLAHIDEFADLPVLVGPSRKRFVAMVYPENTRPSERDGATATIAAYLMQRGVWGVRVHNVTETRAAIRATELIKEAR